MHGPARTEDNSSMNTLFFTPDTAKAFAASSTFKFEVAHSANSETPNPVVQTLTLMQGPLTWTPNFPPTNSRTRRGGCRSRSAALPRDSGVVGR